MRKSNNIWQCKCTQDELAGAIAFLELCGYGIWYMLKREMYIKEGHMLGYDGEDILRMNNWKNDIHLIKRGLIFESVQEMIGYHVELTNEQD